MLYGKFPKYNPWSDKLGIKGKTQITVNVRIKNQNEEKLNSTLGWYFRIFKILKVKVIFHTLFTLMFVLLQQQKNELNKVVGNSPLKLICLMKCLGIPLKSQGNHKHFSKKGKSRWTVL